MSPIYPLASRILPRLLKHSPMIVVDAGAGAAGEYTRWESLFPDVRLYAFEPDEAETLRMAQASAHNAEYVFNSTACLGRDEKNRPLYISKERFNSSFLRIDDKHYYRKRAYADGHPIRQTETFAVDKIVNVDSVSLDTFFLENGGKSPDYIKLDIEGIELELMEASPRSVESAVAISVDVIFHADWIDAPTFADIDTYMRRNGFALYDLRSLKKNEQFSAPMTFYDEHGKMRGQTACGDAVYIRDHLTSNRPCPPFELLLKTAVAAEVNHVATYAFELLAIALDQAPDVKTRKELELIIAEATRDHANRQAEFSGHRRLKVFENAVKAVLPDAAMDVLRPVARGVRRMFS
jgi:FkbM family methyltransferase